MFMPTQHELLQSAKKIDDRLNKSKSLVKQHKKGKAQIVKAGNAAKTKIEAKQNGRLI
jgi:hypothetical protein